ncbi:hypothetical protein AB9M62_02245 [Bacillales bacterium AN1005]|uniref:hypothetical protein n=1 Tax=Niallia taxi TaxID=2499688 RepID=UPI002E1D948E|nr:hypothetical protein [Niallia taxi]
MYRVFRKEEANAGERLAVKIAVKGSILTKIPIVQSVFIDKIKEKLPETKFITDDVSSTLGGYYLALKKLKEY